MIDALEMAQNALKQSESCSLEFREWWQQQASIYAAIAQAEQLKRMADAAEKRNQLLEEYNAVSKESAERHTASIATSVKSFVDAVYGENGSES